MGQNELAVLLLKGSPSILTARKNSVLDVTFILRDLHKEFNVLAIPK